MDSAEQQERFRTNVPSLVDAIPGLSSEDRQGLLLCIQGTDVNFRDDRGWPSLYYASLLGCVEVARELLKHEDVVDVNISDYNGGDTPLSIAITARRSEVVCELLKRKEVDVNVRDNDGRTPLIIACLEVIETCHGGCECP